MIEELLPTVVASASTVEEVVDEPLFPEEAAVIAKAVQARRQEFITVRACARQALAALGMERQPLVPQDRGAPTWPRGIVGSMTHCPGYRAAAVARTAHLVTIGVDAEPNERLPDGVLEMVASPSEQRHLAELTPTVPSPHWDRLLFSAKESIYKAWFPLMRSWLDFDETELSIDTTRRTFTARLLVAGPTIADRRLGTFHGRWAAGENLVTTAVVVARGGLQLLPEPDLLANPAVVPCHLRQRLARGQYLRPSHPGGHL